MSERAASWAKKGKQPGDEAGCSICLTLCRGQYQNVCFQQTEMILFLLV